MGNKTGTLETQPDSLKGPVKIISDNWGRGAVEDVPLWPYVTQGIYPMTDTLSKDCVGRSRMMLEERAKVRGQEEKKKGKKGRKEKTDRHSFWKWETRAEIRAVKSEAGLMMSQKLEGLSASEQQMNDRCRCRAREQNLPHPYAHPQAHPPPNAPHPQIAPTLHAPPAALPHPDSGSDSGEEDSSPNNLYPNLNDFYASPSIGNTFLNIKPVKKENKPDLSF